MWIPREGDAEAEWTSNLDLFLTHCHECIIRDFAPNSYGEFLTQLYRYIHNVLYSTHLLEDAPRGDVIVGPDALRHPSRCPTLTMLRWQPERKTGPQYQYVEQFSILGELPPRAGEPYQVSDFSFYPYFRFFSNNEDSGPTQARIFVAFIVRHPEVPEAELQLILDQNDFSRPYLMFTFGWNQVTPAELALLNREGMNLFLNSDPGGRETLAERQKELRVRLHKMADDWNAKNARPPKNIEEFCRHFDVRVQTLRDHLKAAQFGAWRNYRKRLLLDATPSRGARVIRR
jgi:hypothetical protein